ncbi:hypothetical protein [Devosia rhizoryzae]|uniref:Uncharacterized protein n=1 Tax=Devosia rhizoryzae TaxID=2774137 RepID=A0ABX7C6E3_9HYPH|nr:hypothetical protein [Devosia rhizoryzae]QQR38834.1 hypothetical protein JI748_13910 [Devosia rhizoryzae]
MPLVKSVLPVLAAMALVSPALAQTTAPALPVTTEEGHLVLEAQEQKFSLPKPDWIDQAAENWSELVSPRFTEIGNQAHLEIYPRGEGEAFWTTLYGARVTSMAEPVLAEVRAAVIEVYARSCRPEATAFFQLEADDGDNLPPLGFVCGSYLDPANADQGEVMIIGFYKSDRGVAMLYQGWRGPAFDPAVTGTWPVTPSEVEQHVARFKAEPVLTRAD